MDTEKYSEIVLVKGEPCMFDPVRNVVVVNCTRCGGENHVESFDEQGETCYLGFVCVSCGRWNAYDD